ncbi:hypothetical protein H0E87_031623, partial [Populus deltoides]
MIPCISSYLLAQAAYHFLPVYQNGSSCACMTVPSIDTLEFAKALSSEAKARSSE